MARVILFAGLLLACGDLRRATGAPSVLGPAAMSGLPHNSAARHPKEELELESLKTKVLTAAKPTGMKESVVAPVAKPSLMPASYPAVNSEMSKKAQVAEKAPVNMEHPAPSDNHNENSEKNKAKQQPSPGFAESPLLPQMEERSTADKTAGVLKAGQDYTPQDIAEYIFWTGDERRIAVALNDFLQDELVTKEDVVRFLEDVKRELNSLRNRYSAVNQGNTLLENTGRPGFSFDQPQRNFIPKQRFFELPSKKDIMGDWNSGNNNYNDGWSTGNLDKSFWSSTPNNIPSLISLPSTSSSSSSSSAEENNGVDYEEVFEKIREADAKYREFSLEEIIYQLAKELFSQDELQGQSQRSIQKFAHFVENEANLGRIPKDLSKAVLDTLVAALVDAVSEHAKNTATEQQQQQPALVARGKPRELKQKLEKLKIGAM